MRRISAIILIAHLIAPVVSTAQKSFDTEYRDFLETCESHNDRLMQEVKGTSFGIE